MRNERRQAILRRVVRQWCRAGKHVAIAMLMTLWAVGCAIRATLHFATLPIQSHARRQPSELAKLTGRTTRVAVEAMCVIVPLAMLVWQWS